MRAWRVETFGDPADVMRLVDLPDPVPGEGEVLLRVEAAALNFADTLLCQGLYQERPPFPFTPGFEAAGRVEAVGPGVTGFEIGMRCIVAPRLPNGGMAEKIVVRPDQLLPVPDALPAQQAAAFSAYQTGYLALHRRAEIRPGEMLLVHAGAGGVGSAAIQLGKAAGARVIATAGGAAKTELCLRLGADEAIDYNSEDVVERVKAITGGAGADIIYDPVGANIFDQSRKCIAFEGRLLTVGFAGGRIPDVPAGHVMVKNYSVVGVHCGLYHKRRPDLIAEWHAALVELFLAGKIDPLIGDAMPMEEAVEGLARIGARGTTGKSILLL